MCVKGVLNSFIIRLRLNVSLTHKNMSYRDSETKGNVIAQKRKQRGETSTNDKRQINIHII